MSGQFIFDQYGEIQKLVELFNEMPLPIAPGYAKYPGHTPIWNAAMDLGGQNLGWDVQPYVDSNPGRDSRKRRIADWKGDFTKTMDDGLRVFVEIELGNAASAFRNLAKFDLAMKLDNYDFFLLGVPGEQAKKDVQYATSFDEIYERKELYRYFIHTPCVIFEIEPETRLNLLEETNCSIEEVKGRMGPDQSKEFIRKYGIYSQWDSQSRIC